MRGDATGLHGGFLPASAAAGAGSLAERWPGSSVRPPSSLSSRHATPPSPRCFRRRPRSPSRGRPHLRTKTRSRRTRSLADLARAAVERLALAAYPEFADDAGSGRSAADAFLSRLSIAPTPGSRAIAITFTSRDRNLAARGANTVAGLCRSVSERGEGALRPGRRELACRQDRGRQGQGRQRRSEGRGAPRRLRPPSGGGGQTAGPDQASDLNTKLSAARAATVAAAGKASLLRDLEREGRLADAPPSIVDKSLRRLLDQRVALKAEIATRRDFLRRPRMKDLAPSSPRSTAKSATPPNRPRARAKPKPTARGTRRMR